MQKLKIISINSNCVYMSYIHDTIPNHAENLFNTINLENKFLFILYCEKSAKHIHRFNEILHYRAYRLAYHYETIRNNLVQFY
jgi:hypothetical protein